MEKHELQKKLEELHRELQHTDGVDAAEREALQALQRDIGVVLSEKEGARATHYENLMQRLSESVEKLEASHPQASLLMGQVIEALANLGI